MEFKEESQPNDTPETTRTASSIAFLEGPLRLKNPRGVSGLKPWWDRWVVVNEQGVSIYSDEDKVETIVSIRWEQLNEVHWFSDKKNGTRYVFFVLVGMDLRNAVWRVRNVS